MVIKEEQVRILDEFFDLCLFQNTNVDSTELLNPIHNFVNKNFNVRATGLFLENKGVVKLYPLDLETRLYNLKGNPSIINRIKNSKKDFMYISSDEDEILFNELEEENNLKELFIIPLFEDNSLLGFLFFYIKKGTRFSDFHIRLLKLISNILGLIISKEKLLSIMEHRVAELTTLQNVSGFVNSTLDIEKLLDVSLDALIGLIGIRTCSILILTDELFEDIHSRKQKGILVSLDNTREIVVDVNKGIFKQLSLERKTISGYTKNDEKGKLEDFLYFDSLKDKNNLHYVILPITRGQDIIGTINIFDSTFNHLVNVDNNFLESFANQFSTALQNAQLYQKKKELANRDGLTGLYNHAYFQNRLSLLIDKKIKFPLSLLFLDIDDFKRVNDQYGHLTGDKVLKELSGLLKKHCRNGDLIARYGGEEFAIILPETEKEETLSIANRIVTLVSQHKIWINNTKSINITISMGLAVYKPGWSKEYFIDQADKALYKAKNEGKNRYSFIESN